MPKLDNATAKAVNNAEGSAFTLLPEDKYRLKLVKVAVAPKPDKNGDGAWIWSYEIISGELSGDQFKGKPTSNRTGLGENQQWWMKRVFDAFAVKPNVDTDEILGQEIYALISQREIQAGARKGQMTNDFSDVLTLSDGAADAKGDDWTADDDAKVDDEPDF